MTARVAELLRLHHAGLMSTNQLITGLRRIGVADPAGLANDTTLPDPSSAGFEQRIQPYIAPSPTLGWLR